MHALVKFFHRNRINISIQVVIDYISSYFLHLSDGCPQGVLNIIVMLIYGTSIFNFLFVYPLSTHFSLELFICQIGKYSELNFILVAVVI